MDRLAIAGGTAVASTAITAAMLGAGTPEAVLGALLLAGVVTGGASRTFQSEFLDAFAAGTMGFAVAVTLVAWGFGGVVTANAFYGNTYNFGLVVYLAAVAFSPVPGLVAALGGGVGARLRRAVDGAVGGA